MTERPLRRRVYLIGFMGAGKTTLGRRLAACLGWVFHDLDNLIEEKAGMSIRAIFEQRGEAHFRTLERRLLEETARGAARAVIACGGGAFESPRNRDLIRSSGVAVWLDQPFEQIWRRRAELAGSRPLLRDEPGLRTLYDARRRGYRQAELRLPIAEGQLDRALGDLLALLRGKIEVAGEGA